MAASVSPRLKEQWYRSNNCHLPLKYLMVQLNLEQCSYTHGIHIYSYISYIIHIFRYSEAVKNKQVQIITDSIECHVIKFLLTCAKGCQK